MPHRIEKSDRPPRPRPNGPDISELRNAIANETLDHVELIFTHLQETEDLDTDRLAACISDAVELERPSILSFLIAKSVPWNLGHVKQAAIRGCTPILEVFLKCGWDINIPVSRLQPPLLSNVFLNSETTAWFLAHGADPNAECDLDITPLSVAVGRAPLSIVNLLFESGGSVNHGQLLHYAATRSSSDTNEVLDLLMRQGARGINARLHEHRPHDYGMLKFTGLGTPLHIAVEEGLLSTVRYFVEHGADTAIKTSRGDTPIALARHVGRDDVVEYLNSL